MIGALVSRALQGTSLLRAGIFSGNPGINVGFQPVDFVYKEPAFSGARKLILVETGIANLSEPAP